jgi:hypothetical protein
MSRCEYCDKGVPYHYHNFYDGGGRIKFHHGPEYYGYDPDKWETWPCKEWSWLDRHPVYALMIVLVLLWLATIGVTVLTNL